MLVYQYDHAGLYVAPTEADESPLEPGMYLIPARCTPTPPPDDHPNHQWPRWNGAAWELVNRPRHTSEQTENDDPVEKLKQFLADNPDVAELLTNQEAPA
ncbi:MULTISPECIES: hypothetical protein [unclassified Halomonas]|uniref:hypothetical protein n=1 Tax=unclassified Halomonas TaxID=2609666 RepID=UPI002888C21E|nr:MULTISPECIES: hypothetical protein [unclassified Halomonas]MDT0502726.1 hypothetical protein [Halomonas sp. PAR7]MDT0511008.1 hypothetical protein [Halomonas sp. LES1]MDT0592475.1 hypothetical protein [Halomonas sp. PAR8]